MRQQLRSPECSVSHTASRQLARKGRKAVKNCSGTSRWGMCPQLGTTTRVGPRYVLSCRRGKRDEVTESDSILRLGVLAERHHVILAPTIRSVGGAMR